MADREPIRDFSGKIIAWQEYMSNGDIIVREFTGRVLGKYDKQHDVTRDFYGRIIAKGCVPGVLIGRS